MGQLKQIVDAVIPGVNTKDKYGYNIYPPRRTNLALSAYPNCCGIYVLTAFGETDTDGANYAWGGTRRNNYTAADRLFDLYCYEKTHSNIGQWQIALNHDQWKIWEPILVHLGFKFGEEFYHTAHGKRIKLFTFDWNEKPAHGRSTKRSFPDYFETRSKFFPHIIKELKSEEVQPSSEPVPKKTCTRSKVKPKEESPTIDKSTIDAKTVEAFRQFNAVYEKNTIDALIEEHKAVAEQIKSEPPRRSAIFRASTPRGD